MGMCAAFLTRRLSSGNLSVHGLRLYKGDMPATVSPGSVKKGHDGAPYQKLSFSGSQMGRYRRSMSVYPRLSDHSCKGVIKAGPTGCAKALHIISKWDQCRRRAACLPSLDL